MPGLKGISNVSQRRALIVGNWKMAKGIQATAELARGVRAQLPHSVSMQEDRVLVGAAPSPMAFHKAFEVSCLRANEGKTAFLLGGQNFFAAKGKDGFVYEGAYTGETSLPQLAEAHADFTLLGHSETRAIEGYGVTGLGLTDAMLNTRVLAALDFIQARPELKDFFIIFCVGETLADRDAGKTNTVLARQIEIGLAGVPAELAPHLAYAYEPVWAIGTGVTATTEDANKGTGFIRTLIEAKFSGDAAEKAIIQYGGSAKPENTRELMSQPNVDGLLIGGAALKADSLVKMATITEELYTG